MGRIFNVLVPVVVLSAYFQHASGSCSSEGSAANDDSVSIGGYTTGTEGSASSWSTGYYGNSAAYSSGSATGSGLYGNFGNGGGSLGYSQGGGTYNGGGSLGYSQGGGAYNGGGSLGYSQGGGAYNGGFNGEYGSNSVSGASGGVIQYNPYPSRGFMREVASDIADTVVDAIKVGHSLMHRPHVKPSYVKYSRPAYVHQVVRVPNRVVSVHRGYTYRGCRH